MKERRRSKNVPATLTAMIAAALAGCSGGVASNRCEDGRGMRLSDIYCGPNPPPLPAGAFPPAHWVHYTSGGGYGSTGYHGFWGGFGGNSGTSTGGVSRGGFGGFGGSGG